MMKRVVCAVFSGLAFFSYATAQPNDPRELLRSEKWTEAVTAYQKIVSENPYSGVNYYYYGVALEKTGNCSAAEPALNKAIALGVNGAQSGMRLASYSLARCAAMQGATDTAVNIIEHAWRNYALRDFASIDDDEAFAAILSARRYRTLAGLSRPIATADRAKRWRADIDYYQRLIAETHPDPFHTADKAQWLTDLKELRTSVGRRGDHEIIKTLMALTARIGDGHTSLFPPIEGDGAWRMLPIWPTWFRDGWYVAAANPEFAHLAGAKIETAGGRAFKDIETSARQYLASDNSMTGNWLASVALQFAEFYTPKGKDGSELIKFGFTLPDGTAITESLPVGPIDRDPMASAAPDYWISGSSASGIAGSDLNQPFYHQKINGTKTVYARINKIADADGQTFEEYGKELTEHLNQEAAQSVIIDLRLNNGGNGNLRWGFIRHLMTYEPLQKDKSVYLLVGPRSYSATIMFANTMRSLFDVTFVGLPTGGRPVGYSTETPFTLPNSGLNGTISTRLHVDGLSANDQRPWIAPDIVAWPDGADWRAGRDSVFEAALEDIYK